MFSFRAFATKCCKQAPINFDFRMSANKKSGVGGGVAEAGKGVIIKHYIGDFIITLPCLEHITSSECAYLV